MDVGFIMVVIVALVTAFWTGVAMGYSIRSAWAGAAVGAVVVVVIWAAVTALVPFSGREFMCGSLVAIGVAVGLGQNIGAWLWRRRGK